MLWSWLKRAPVPGAPENWNNLPIIFTLHLALCPRASAYYKYPMPTKMVLCLCSFRPARCRFETWAYRAIFACPWIIVSVSGFICFISQWMKRTKHGLFVFPPKKTLIWRRHCAIDQSCCSMTSKRFLESSSSMKFFQPRVRLTNQKPGAFVSVR